MQKSAKSINTLISLLGVICGIGQAASNVRAEDNVHPVDPGIVEVIANGTGCPAGTWSTTIGDDGLSVIAKFTAYGAAVEADESFDTNNCMLSIEPAYSDHFEYAIDTVVFEGETQIATGAEAELMLRSYITGAADAAVETSMFWEGPYSGARVSYIGLGTAAQPWTSCGPAYNLNLNTRVVLRNAEDAIGPSFVDFSSVKPGANASITVRLAARPCGA